MDGNGGYSCCLLFKWELVPQSLSDARHGRRNVNCMQISSLVKTWGEFAKCEHLESLLPILCSILFSCPAMKCFDNANVLSTGVNKF